MVSEAVRLGPEDYVAEVTARQVRRVVEDLIVGGQWKAGNAGILIVFDAGYDAPRMAHLLHGLPVEVLGRLRSDRVMRKPVPKPWSSPPQGGRPPKHGKEFCFAKPETWGEPDAETVQVTDRYGPAQAMAWDRIHPRLTTRSAWISHDGEFPIVEGTLIRLQAKTTERVTFDPPSEGQNSGVAETWSAPRVDGLEAVAAKYAADWPARGHRKIAAMMRADGHQVSTSTVPRSLR